MNIRLIKSLLILCALFLTMIIGEWLYAIYAQKQLLSSIETVGKAQKPLAQLPELDLTKQPESNYVNLVNRPLFIAGRRPVNEAPATTATVSTATENFNWSLNGIYTKKGKLFALLSRTGAKVAKDNYRKVTKNSDIDGWLLSEIHKDRVVVSLAGKLKDLPLRKIKPKGANNNPNQQQEQQAGMQNGGMPPNIPGQVPQNPEQIPGAIPGQIPGQIPVPPPEIVPEQLPDGTMVEPIPEPVPEEPIMDPEMIPPEDSTEIYPENSENVQIQ